MLTLQLSPLSSRLTSRHSQTMNIVHVNSKHFTTGGLEGLEHLNKKYQETLNI